MFSWIGRFLSSSLGKKSAMAVSGLALVGFLVVHLAGNLTLFGDDTAFEQYAQKLHDLGPILLLMEAGLLLLFVVHINFAVRTIFENMRARESRYAVPNDHGGRTIGSSTMKITGVVILVFLVVHLWDFRFDGDFKGRFEDGLGGLGAAHDVRNTIGGLGHAAFYLVCIAALLLHLSHAVKSALQTLGIRHPRWTPILERAAVALGWALGLGFASIVVYSAVA
ncbi:MAG: succinate dehydrogenase cytochrome b subunit [Planctomycetota bacterium]